MRVVEVPDDARLGEIVVLDLDDCLIQRRPDGLFRETSPAELEAELTGELKPNPDDWWSADLALGALNGGQRFIWGHTDDGVPQRIVVGTVEQDVVQAYPLRGCRRDRRGQRVELVFTAASRFFAWIAPPGYLRSSQDAGSATGGGWFGHRPEADTWVALARRTGSVLVRSFWDGLDMTASVSK